MQIGKRRIGSQAPCFIIAEAGTSHCGKLENAFRLIDKAACAGADCIKFQAVIADEILHPLSGTVDLPGGKIPLYQRFKELERDRDFYLQLKEYTEKMGKVFLCSAFGITSARLLHSIGVQAIKIASPELNHYPLLEEVSRYNLPLIISTGVSTMEDIEKAVATAGKKTILLHCITAYPAPESQYNLKVIRNLELHFGIPVGVSDHSADPVLVPGLAVVSGACAVEKHITLNKKGSGLDDLIALDSTDFSAMVSEIRRLEQMPEHEGLSLLEKRYGREKIRRVLGDGIKRLAPSEADSYSTTNRSIHARVEIAAGEILTMENICIVRSEKNLKPGLGPEYLKAVMGSVVKNKIPPGQGITREDLKAPALSMD